MEEMIKMTNGTDENSMTATKGDVLRLGNKVDTLAQRQEKIVELMCEKMERQTKKAVKLHYMKCKLENKNTWRDKKESLVAVGVAVGTAIAVVVQHFGLV